MKNFILITLLILVCACGQLMAQGSCQNKLYLKNGSIIKGCIVELVPNDKVKIQTADGSLFVFEMSEVEKIEADTAPTTTKNKPVKSDESPVRTKGFTGAVELGMLYLGESELAMFTGNLMGGYQFNQYFALSLGAGAEMGEGLVMIPVYLDFRAFLLDGKYTPFFALDGGYAWGAYDWEAAHFDEGGVMAQALVGGRFMMKKHFGINVSLGYRFQSFSAYGQDHGAVFKVGFAF